MSPKKYIEEGKAVLGIELGSTRIKAVLIGENKEPIASGSHEWQNRLVNNIWTYTLDDIKNGLQDCYKKLSEDVIVKYDIKIHKLGAIGISAMMHGYMVFDEKDELMVPFRTWRNTMTEKASEKLTSMFDFHIPQRWSIAHLYQAMLNEEEHVEKVAFLSTLSCYVHWMLTGKKVVGIGEASGMFPVDGSKNDYDLIMMEKFDREAERMGYKWKIRNILPKVLCAGDGAGILTEKGAKFLDVSGNLEAGIPMCPPEGDAGTGMTATNSVKIRTGNVSAGTSVFAMAVLDKKLSKVHKEIDIVTTPDGNDVAMVHCNNCTSDLNSWVGIFKEFCDIAGISMSMDELYETLYNKALDGNADGGGLLAYNYFSGEHITGLYEGRPMLVRRPDSIFNLANLMRVNLFTALGALKIGLDLLINDESVKLDNVYGHGGLFKTKNVGQKILAAAMNTPVTVMKTAGEGGAWGMALLADYMLNKDHSSLPEFLDKKVFTNSEGITVLPDERDVDGFNSFIERYKKGLMIEKTAVDFLN